MTAIREFTPKNLDKYVGTFPILSRSSWELFFMKKLDLDPRVLRWASESLAIPYISPVDGKKHKYDPDFIVEFKTPKGIVKEVIELKPMKECLPGTAKKPKAKAYQDMVYLKNQAKWEAAKVLCEDNGFQFRVLTEKELFGK
jgi:hypothetical protein